MNRAPEGGEPGWQGGAPIEWWEHWAALRMWRSDRRFRWVILGLVGAALVGCLGGVRWVPGHEAPDGKRTFIGGWDWLAASWHDFRMGVVGHPGFRPDPVAWEWRVRLDPGNPESVRALLESLARMPEPELSHVTNGLAWGQQLWRVGGTNAADVERVFRIARNAHVEEWILGEAAGLIGEMGPVEREAWATVAADHERWDVVRRLLAEGRLEVGGTVAHAWTALWGTPTASREALAVLEERASGLGPESLKAGRLQVQVGVRMGKVEAAMGAAERLRVRGVARRMEGVRVGRLWWAAGRRDEARKWLDGWTAMAREPREVPEWGALVREIQGAAKASLAWREGWKRWRRAEWLGPMLESVWEARDWGGFMELGAELRQDPGGSSGQIALGWVVEGIARDATGRALDAESAWESARSQESPDPDWALAWVKRIAGWGYVRVIPEWVAVAERAGEKDPEYWRLRVRLARTTGDSASLDRAAAGLRRLSPWEPEAVNAAAMAKLWMPVPVDQAMELLSEARYRKALDLEGRALEVIALGRAGRTNESMARWSELKREPMRQIHRTMVCLAGFEMHALAGRVEAAMEEYRQIEGKYLMPSQVRWLEQEFLRLDGRRKLGRASKPGQEP
jgi:hypothetical protein